MSNPVKQLENTIDNYFKQDSTKVGPIRSKLTNVNQKNSIAYELNQPRPFKFGTDEYQAVKGHQRGGGRGNKALADAYFGERNKKLENQAMEHIPDGPVSQIFRNCIIYVNGFTNGISDLKLRRMITSNGGKVVLAHGTTVTHFLCSQLTDRKAEILLDGKKRPYVITPEWITESIKQGKRLSESKFRLQWT